MFLTISSSLFPRTNRSIRSLHVSRILFLIYLLIVAQFQSYRMPLIIELFDVIGSGVVNISINQKYGLKDAAQAHIDLEGRKTTGSTVLIP